MGLSIAKIEFLVLVLGLTPLAFSQSPTPERPKKFGHSLIEFERRSTPQPNKQTEADNGEVLRVETNLVITDVLVVDQTGSVVAGLQKSDFVVSEDEKPQKMELFSFGKDERVPKSIVLVMEAGTHPLEAFKRNIEAAQKLISRLGAGDRMAIVTDNIALLTGLTDDKKTLSSALERLGKHPGAGRREYSTLIAVLREIFHGDERLPIILLQSSGDEFIFTKPIWPATLSMCRKGVKDWCERSFSFRDVLDVVERSRATIYGIIPQPRVAGLDAEEQKRKVAIILDAFSDEVHGRRERTEKEKFRQIWNDLTIRETVAMQQSVIDGSSRP